MTAEERRERNREYQRTYRARHPEKARQIQADHKIKSKWGMSRVEYTAYLSTGCSICGGTASVVDHCHVSGRIRGPLCRTCNIGVGHFQDDPALLQAAAAYLQGD